MFTLNQVLVSSWGYEQTNVDFYQVVGLTPKSVKLRKIQKENKWHRDEVTHQEDSTAGGFAVPLQDQFAGDVFTRRVREDSNYIKIDDRVYASPWDGAPAHFTCYA